MRVWGGSAGLAMGGVLLMVAACATAPRPGVNHDRVITRSELASASGASMYEAIGSLRPGWLGPEGPPAVQAYGLAAEVPVEAPPWTAPSVYMNRLYLGDPTALARVRVRDVAEVRLISPELALDRYGSDNPAGVIEVVTRDVGAYD